MNRHTPPKPSRLDVWTKDLGLPREPGYDEWLAAEIEAGLKEIESGDTVPIEEVIERFEARWKSD